MIRTTNFLVHKNKIDFSELRKERILVRYSIPKTFKDYARYRDYNAYAKFENYYKELLERPCYRFIYDKGGAAIYVLHQKDDNITPLTFKLDTPDSETFEFQITPSLIDFEDPNLKTHVLLKVLLADFFYNENKTHRICQHYFYLFGRNEVDTKGEPKGFARGVYIGLKEQNKGDFLEYSIVPQTTNFSRTKGNIQKHWIKLYPFYEVVTQSGSQYFRQIKPSEVLSFQQNSSKEIWGLSRTSKSSKAHLDWHTDNPDLQKSTRGYVVFQFQNRFISYLNEMLGKNVAEPKFINAQKFESRIKIPQISGIAETGLPIHVLKKIYVYDNRMKEGGNNINPIPLQRYIDLLNRELQKITDKKGKTRDLKIQFFPIRTTDEFSSDKAVLVLQDVAGTEFNEEKKDKDGKIINEGDFLYEVGLDDPKTDLYDLFSWRIPLQSMNINTNKHKNRAGRSLFTSKNYADYFNYDVFNLMVEKTIKSGKKKGETKVEKTPFYHKLRVCLNELLLKYYIINQLPIHEVRDNSYPLPCIVEYPKLLKYIFQFQQILLHTNENGQLVFTDLKTKQGKQKRNEILKRIGISWENVVADYYRKNWLENKSDDEKSEKLRGVKFIFMPNIAIEIQDLEERVLFQYDKGSKRNKETKIGLDKIWFDKESDYYIIGHKHSINITLDKAIQCRKLKFYQNANNFNYVELLETLAVQFVRNKQYTVYPYFFDLINLYLEIKGSE